jgi:hypothetical protein
MAKAPEKSPYLGGGSFGAIPKWNHGNILAEVGSSGLRVFGGYVREEFATNLIGRQATTVYREMMDNSPIIGAIMFAIEGAMRKVEWRVLPGDGKAGDKEIAFVESLRVDMENSWADFVVEALSMLGYGYSVHETVYKRRNGPKPFGSKVAASKFNDGLVGWKKLPTRSQDTILKWFLDANGSILGLTQQPWLGPLIDLPAEKMLLFRPKQHKGNPEGKSVIRSAYRSYYFVKRLEEFEAIRLERMAGNVIVRVPNQLLDAAASGDAGAIATLNAYKNMATRAKTDEQMGLVLPSDVYPSADGKLTNSRMFDYEYITPAGGTSGIGANEPIVRHKLDMLTATLTDFIQMGHSNRGAQNLADTKVDLFLSSVEGWLNSMAGVLNNDGLPRLWALNGFDREAMPIVVPDMAQQADLDLLGNFILRLSQSGVQMFPDADLEEYVRDVAGLPDAVDGKPWSSTLVENSGGEPPKDKPKTTAKAIVDAVMSDQLRTRKRRA